jgi:hypothetical protein
MTSLEILCHLGAASKRTGGEKAGQSQHIPSTLLNFYCCGLAFKDSSPHFDHCHQPSQGFFE